MFPFNRKATQLAVQDAEVHTARSFYTDDEDIDILISSSRSSTRRTASGPDVPVGLISRYARNKRALLGRRASDRQFDLVREQAQRML